MSAPNQELDVQASAGRKGASQSAQYQQNVEPVLEVVDLQQGTRDRFFEPPDLPPPGEVLPDPSCVVVLDQGDTSASVGFALSSVINYMRRERGVEAVASPWMLYHNARRYDEREGESYEGTSLRGAMIAWWQHGVCDLPEWPAADKMPSEDALQRAAGFKPAAFARVHRNVDDLRSAVHHMHAVVVSATLHDGWPTELQRGEIPFLPGTRGGHAFAVIGYNAHGFIVLNSWGADWGGVPVGGMKLAGAALWTYEDARANITDAWVARIPGRVLSRTARRAGYRTDSVEGKIEATDDRLGILNEVRALAAVAAARDVEPPLSIGLFGDWGTGKSFFMRQLQGQIEAIDTNAKNDPNSVFCSNIVQIRFNAWHYLDTNLWASLVSQIFSSLLDQIQIKETDQTKRQRLEKELRDASRLLQVSHGALQSAKTQEQDAQKALVEKKEELAQAQNALRAVAGDLTELAVRDPILKSRLSALQAELGLAELPATIGQIQRDVTEIVDNSKRVSKVAQDLLRPERRGIRLALIMFAGVVLAVALFLFYPGAEAQLRIVAAVIGQIAGSVAAAAVWVRDRLKQIRPKAERLQSLLQEVDAIYDQRVNELTRQERAEVELKEAAVRDAARAAQAAETRVHQIQSELARLEPDAQLREFILTRGGSTDYTKQLGIISMVRNDFERLSDLLRKNQPGCDDSDGADRPRIPVQRIILYIDDLDRCPPDRVVAVLEAVHLLLAFRLFVVVVAVDPRWLRRSLEKHYPDLLRVPDEAVRQVVDATRPSTPQDYLEKIFQIPLYLRPISADGYRGLIDQLAGNDVDADADSKAAAEAATNASTSANRPLVFPDGVGTGELLVEDPHPNPEQLRFREWELKEMERMAMLFRTPRAVKRFVNTYRLVRAMVPATELAAFEGTRAKPGEYRWPMMLLAVLAGYPNTGLRFVVKLHQASLQTPQITMSDFLAQTFVEPKPAVASIKSQRMRKAASVVEPTATATTDIFAAEWSRLHQALSSIQQPHTIAPFQRWLTAVARFSFAPDSTEAVLR